MANPFDSLLASPMSLIERRLLAEYGSVFVTTATPPPVIVFSDEIEVQRFQESLYTERAVVGSYEVELQSHALKTLIAAGDDAAKAGVSISARAADAGRRSYEQTVSLWRRNVGRGLEYWQERRRLDPNTAATIADLSLREQVAAVLDLESKELLYFGTYFDKSILSSVAAPGSSQHLSMLAFDVAEYEDRLVEEILGHHGWFRTVANDLPHFTFLGRSETALPVMGLMRISRTFGAGDYRFWVPALPSS